MAGVVSAMRTIDGAIKLIAGLYASIYNLTDKPNDA